MIILLGLYEVEVIQLQGDQRKNVSTFLVQASIVKKEHRFIVVE